MNKLYTEEQMFNFAKRIRENMTDGRMLKREQILAEFTPIQLPTEEEIEKDANGYVVSKWEYAQDENKESFIDGAKWMRDKIKGIQNEK